MDTITDADFDLFPSTTPAAAAGDQDRKNADAENNRAWHGGLSKSQRSRRNARERGAKK